ncbi:MAG: phosphoesterase PA-phosphatase related protein [Gemmatimonadetes bacterium]|nr:phosphoesterase PA-phosphatase related protein [Gemmatimonadota bacterium]
MGQRVVIAVLAAAMFLSAPLETARAQGSAVLLENRDLGLLAGATLASAAMLAIDTRVANVMTDSGFHARHPGFKSASNRASHSTETVLMITGGLVWGIARINDDRGTADVAFHTTEAIASTAMVIQVIRGALGRGRPYVVDDDNGEKRNGDPKEFKFMRGFTSYNYRSWPSMHAMASFAAASALSNEMRVRDTPHRALISPVLYTAAAMPALARMYLDEHWASDIAMGVFLGVFAGQKAVLYSHAHPNNTVDRRFLKPTVRATFTHDARGLSFSLLPY